MKPPFPSPDLAEQAFYDAFRQTDLDAMMSVWDTDDDIVCVHPLGEILIGRKDIAESWNKILRGDGDVNIRHLVQQQILCDDLAVHVVHEVFELPGQTQLPAPVIVTNSYRKTTQGDWRMILHHASPSPQQVRVVSSAPAGTVH